MHIHVLMLCRKFELILIKIGFFTNFLSCSKIWSMPDPVLLALLMNVHIRSIINNYYELIDFL